MIQILAALDWTDEQLARAGERMIGLGARILCVALEYDALLIKGVAKAEILQTLQARELRFGAPVLEALTANVAVAAERELEIEMPLRDAKPGMRLRDEIRTSVGALLVPVGFEISERLLQRISQVAPDVLDQTVRLVNPIRLSET